MKKIDPQSRRERGIAAYASQFGVNPAELEAHFAGIVGERMANEAIQAAGGGAWDDDCLSLRDRSLIVIASLITQGGADQRLRGHIRWALEHGATPDELEETATLLAIYTGYPRAAAGMELIRSELEAARGEA